MGEEVEHTYILKMEKLFLEQYLLFTLYFLFCLLPGPLVLGQAVASRLFTPKNVRLEIASALIKGNLADDHTR